MIHTYIKCKEFYLHSYRVLNDSMLIVRDGAFCGKNAGIDRNHPVQLALNVQDAVIVQIKRGYRINKCAARKQSSERYIYCS